MNINWNVKDIEIVAQYLSKLLKNETLCHYRDSQFYGFIT